MEWQEVPHEKEESQQDWELGEKEPKETARYPPAQLQVWRREDQLPLEQRREEKENQVDEPQEKVGTRTVGRTLAQELESKQKEEKQEEHPQEQKQVAKRMSTGQTTQGEDVVCHWQNVLGHRKESQVRRLRLN